MQLGDEQVGIVAGQVVTEAGDLGDLPAHQVAGGVRHPQEAAGQVIVVQHPVSPLHELAADVAVRVVVSQFLLLLPAHRLHRLARGESGQVLVGQVQGGADEVLSSVVAVVGLALHDPTVPPQQDVAVGEGMLLLEDLLLVRAELHLRAAPDVAPLGLRGALGVVLTPEEVLQTLLHVHLGEVVSPLALGHGLEPLPLLLVQPGGLQNGGCAGAWSRRVYLQSLEVKHQNVARFEADAPLQIAIAVKLHGVSGLRHVDLLSFGQTAEPPMVVEADLPMKGFEASEAAKADVVPPLAVPLAAPSEELVGILQQGVMSPVLGVEEDDNDVDAALLVQAGAQRNDVVLMVTVDDMHRYPQPQVLLPQRLQPAEALDVNAGRELDPLGRLDQASHELVSVREPRDEVLLSDQLLGHSLVQTVGVRTLLIDASRRGDVETLLVAQVVSGVHITAARAAER